MGNRGIIHNENQEIVATHRLQGWVTCRLEFKGRQRRIMSPGTYTELFFLDEATAFAAGHRPCGECRRERYVEFKEAWLEANGDLLESKPPTASNIDRIIHRQRIHRGRQVTHRATLGVLPDGTMVGLESAAWLLWRGRILRWSFAGYTDSEERPDHTEVDVLTPRSYVRVFELGFVPGVHGS